MSEAILIRSANVTKKYVDTNLALKQDVVEGKGLSTNDYDNAAKQAVDALGTASKCDTGTAQGNIPILGTNGKLDSSILPSLAISDTFTAENQEQMLALDAQKGDVCVRTDEKKTYILQNDPATEVSNWLELATPTDAVQSVNGKTGIVTLNHEDVGAVQANTEITGATKCKITYDAKGLVTAGEDLTASDIPDISETYETKSNKSDSYTVSSSTTYPSTKALVDGLSSKADIKKFSATVGTSWVQGANNEYTQELTIPDILETDTPIVDLVLSDNIETARTQTEEWANVSRITTSAGKIKLFCYDLAPTTEIPIQLICVR